MMMGRRQPHPVPEESLPVEWVARPVNEGRPESDHRQPVPLVQAEQHPLRHGLIADVRVRVVVRRQRVAFIMIQAVAVRRHAGHENIARQAVATGPHGGLHLRRRGAALPIVDVVVDYIEAPPVQRLLHRCSIVTVRHQVLHASRQTVLRLAVQHGHIMAGVAQLLHELPADE